MVMGFWWQAVFLSPKDVTTLAAATVGPALCIQKPLGLYRPQSPCMFLKSRETGASAALTGQV